MLKTDHIWHCALSKSDIKRLADGVQALYGFYVVNQLDMLSWMNNIQDLPYLNGDIDFFLV